MTPGQGLEAINACVMRWLHHEECDGCLDGRLRSTVPGDAKANILEGCGLIARDGEDQSANGLWAFEVGDGDAAVCGQVQFSD